MYLPLPVPRPSPPSLDPDGRLEQDGGLHQLWSAHLPAPPHHHSGDRHELLLPVPQHEHASAEPRLHDAHGIAPEKLVFVYSIYIEFSACCCTVFM